MGRNHGESGGVEHKHFYLVMYLMNLSGKLLRAPFNSQWTLILICLCSLPQFTRSFCTSHAAITGDVMNYYIIYILVIYLYCTF